MSTRSTFSRRKRQRAFALQFDFLLKQFAYISYPRENLVKANFYVCMETLILYICLNFQTLANTISHSGIHTNNNSTSYSTIGEF